MIQNKITINVPFERHAHFREKSTLMPYVLKYTAAQFWGGVAMPNLSTPIVTWQQAKAYRDDILTIKNEQGLAKFFPVMTAYLTDNTDPQNIREGFEKQILKAVKLYPFGATTNSDKGVTKLENIFPVLEVMQKIQMPLLVHPETDVTRFEVPFLDRERVFTEESLSLIHKEFPKLIISVEHITTKEAAQFVENTPNHIVGTVTPQHLLYNHDALFHNGVPPYKPGIYVENMCLPVLKLEKDREYILNAITNDKNGKWGAGTDTAPHDQTAKHDHCSRCGCFNATHAVELYAMAWDKALETKEGVEAFNRFMSLNTLWIYGLHQSPLTLTLKRESQIIPELVLGDLRPFKAGQTIPWTLSLRK